MRACWRWAAAWAGSRSSCCGRARPARRTSSCRPATRTRRARCSSSRISRAASIGGWATSWRRPGRSSWRTSSCCTASSAAIRTRRRSWEPRAIGQAGCSRSASRGTRCSRVPECPWRMSLRAGCLGFELYLRPASAVLAPAEARGLRVAGEHEGFFWRYAVLERGLADRRAPRPAPCRAPRQSHARTGRAATVGRRSASVTAAAAAVDRAELAAGRRQCHGEAEADFRRLPRAAARASARCRSGRRTSRAAPCPPPGSSRRRSGRPRPRGRRARRRCPRP